ncbi:MAG: caspase family protein, partial [Bradyrhizobium sp.]
MSTRRPIWIAALYSLVLLACSISVAKADRRVALVVGNSNYSNSSLFLSNPKNDATDVAAALRGVGFEVLQVIDANKRDLDLNMAKFARLAIDADAALFYYAGHAVQYQGRNYLMPTDAEVEDEISFRYQMTPLDDVRAALDRGDGVKIVILDACRNNPVVNALRRKKKSGDSRAVDAVRGGLAKIDKAQGMVVAYSTAADEVAADGDGRNSPFTSAFLKLLKVPGLEIEQLFRRVAADVNAQTGGRQRPETYVSLLSNYY